MSSYRDHLRSMGGMLGEQAADEIEELEKAYALLFKENAALKEKLAALSVPAQTAPADGQAEPVASVAWLHRADELRRMKRVFERDRTIVADAISNIFKTLKAHEWLRVGRGSYEWNDERWKDEFGRAFDAIMESIEPLKRLAADWSDCPKSSDEIAKARQPHPTPQADKREAEITQAREALLRVKFCPEFTCAGCKTDLKQVYDLLGTISGAVEYDQAYSLGLRAGWDFGFTRNQKGFDAALKNREQAPSALRAKGKV